MPDLLRLLEHQEISEALQSIRRKKLTDSTSQSQIPFIAGLVGGAFALIGVLSMPYPYYNVMRLVIVASCAVLVGAAIARRKQMVIAPLIVVALFMFLVEGLPKATWSCIDLVVALFLVSIGRWLALQRLTN